ncbi:MAG: TldD/PmbA family protein [Candidatus Bathyarchaeia archaeon]
MFNLRRILDKLTSIGAEDGDLTVIRRERLTVDFTDKVEACRYTNGCVVGFRVAVGRRIGLYLSNDVTPQGLEEAVDKVVKIARASPEDPYWVSAPKGLGVTSVDRVYDERLAKLTPEEAVEIAESTIEGINSSKYGVKSVYGVLNVEISERTIANLHGEEVSRRDTFIVIYATAKAGEGSESATFSDFQQARFMDEVKPYELGREIGLKAYEFIGAKSLDTGLYDLILDGRVAASIFSSLLSMAISADSVQTNRSPLVNKIGSEIMSPKVTFIDDGTVPGFMGSRMCDDEGIPVRRNCVIESGVLKTYLYDTYTANREKRESTGNSHKASATSSRPLPNNLILKPGDYELDEMVGETSKGVYILKTIGEWLSNPVSGYLNATVTHGYLIVNGSIEGRVKGAVIGGDFYQIMKDKVVGLSKDLHGRGNSYSPHVKLERVQLSGS